MFAQFALENDLPGSWFSFVKSPTLKYSLPDPLQYLDNSPTKSVLRRIVCMKVTEIWQKQLTSIATSKPSLKFLRCEYLPLLRGPHPLCLSCKGSRSAVQSASVQARMLSGRYRTDSFAAKWLGGNGSCTLPGCQFPIGNLEHLLSGDCLPLRETMCLAVKSGPKLWLKVFGLYSGFQEPFSGPSTERDCY